MAQVEILTGDQFGQRIWISSPKTLVGRSADSHIWLKHASVSRRHALIVRLPEGSFVVDLDSRYGIRINGTLIDDVAPLHSHNQIQVGDEILLFNHFDDCPTSFAIPRPRRQELTPESPDAMILHSPTVMGLLYSIQASAEVQAEIAAFSLPELFDQAIMPLASRAAARGIVLNYEIDDAIPKNLIGDASRLRQTLTSLYEIAAETLAPGNARIRVVPEMLHERSVSLECVGPRNPISVNEWSGVFRRHVPSHPPADSPSVGYRPQLAMAADNIGRMGGRLWVESTEENGSVFHFTLSLKRER